MQTRLTANGRVTIPKSTRDRVGIVPGDAVAFEIAPDGHVVLTKVGGVRPISRFETMRGRAGAGPSTDQVMALTRGEAGYWAN